jgi:hypothetical protein
LRTNSEIAFPRKFIEKPMVPSESAPQELSNEWSCQQVSKILNCFGEFLCCAVGGRSHHQNPLKRFHMQSLLNTVAGKGHGNIFY